jgi:PAS domain S-box-containing protein
MKNIPFHVKMLLDEVQRRKESNPRYSLRAFSKFLGMGPSTLSRILSNHQELSLSACRNIIKKLQFNHDDCLLFIASVAEEKKLKALRLLSSTIDDNEVASFESMMTSSPDLLFVLDRNGRCIHANDPVAEFFKLPPNQVIGKTLSEIGVPSEISKKIKGYIYDIFQDKKRIKIDECYKAKNGTACFEITLLPILKKGQEIRAVACYWRETSEIVALESLLKLHRDCGEALLETRESVPSLNRVLEIVTQHFSDGAVIHLLDNNVVLKKGQDSLLSEFLELFPLVYDHNQNYRKTLDSGKTEVVCHLDKASFNLFNQMKIELGSFVCIPLLISGKVLGSLTFLRAKDKNPFKIVEIESGNDLSHRIVNFLKLNMLYEKPR